MSRFGTIIAFNPATINSKLATFAAMPHPQRQDRCRSAGAGASGRTLASDATNACRVLAVATHLAASPAMAAKAGVTDAPDCNFRARP
jgi:hypothetical protein